MSEIIREFYKKNGFPEKLIEQKVRSFCKHPDIAEEFEEWIRTGKFCENDAVEIAGYTAKKLSMIKYLNGDGAFTVLIELREDYQHTMEQLKNGLKWK